MSSILLNSPLYLTLASSLRLQPCETQGKTQFQSVSEIPFLAVLMKRYDQNNTGQPYRNSYSCLLF